MRANTERTKDNVTRRSILRKSAGTGTLLIAGGVFASSASARRNDLITVEPDEIFLGTCGASEEVESFEVSLASGGGRVTVDVTGIVEDAFTLGGPDPNSETVTVEGPIEGSGEITVTARRVFNQDQKTVRAVCIPPIE